MQNWSDVEPSLFQFHKGTIKTDEMRARIAQLAYFNSIKVRLKPKLAVGAPLMPNFNSIKVRLKLII